MHPDDASSPDSPPRLPPPEHFRTIWRVIRETHEEVGVLTDPADLAFSHVVHRRNPEGQPRIGFFFTAAGKASQSTVNRTNAPDCTGPTLPGELVTERGAMRQ